MLTRNLISLGFVVFLAPALNTAHAGGKVFELVDKTYREECGGSCHVAYPPQLLPAASWRELMATLDRHFGTDASLEGPQAQEILDFLTAYASKRDARTAEGKPTLRISETAWFRHEHDELSAAEWKRPAVKSAAICGACHQDAEAGDYRERGVRVPK